MMNIAQAKSIPLEHYLDRQGHRPAHARQGGRELWYRSPIRADDDTPSFKVDTQKNVWFDHGLAKGGTIIDLVTEVCACNVRDALRHLEGTGLYSPALSSPMTSRPSQPSPRGSSTPSSTSTASTTTSGRSASPAPDAPRLFDVENDAAPAATDTGAETSARGASRRTDPAGEKEKDGGGETAQAVHRTAFELIASKPLEHPALLQYLRKRGIDPDLARKYVSQIDFKAPQRPGTYFALGYPAGNGFEARNALFKGFVGTGKSVTFHDTPGSTTLQVFEGFMDYLSYLTIDRPTQPVGSVLVLNSTNLWQRALPYLNDPRYDEIRLYLDNDSAGDAATQKLFEHAQTPSKLADMRAHYARHEDLNAWLLDRKP
jgi:hypothetical protein